MPPPYTWSLPQDPRAAATTRRHLREQWGDLPPPLLDSVLLAVTELVTNAVRYGGGDVVGQVWPGPDRLRVEVTDPNPRVPQPRRATPDEEGGRGLLVVDALASRWGSQTDATRGKTVWCEFELGPTEGRLD